MKCIIIDDEPLAIDVIKNHIEKFEGLELIKSFHRAAHAFEFIQTNEIDILFLDIQMPNLSGLEFLQSLGNPPMTIITTAYRKYALEGYELDILDYLVKPIEYNRFLKAVSKAYRRKNKNLPKLQSVREDENQFLSNNPNPYVYLKVDKTIEKVFLDEIYLVESMKNYVKIQTLNKHMVIYSSISKLEEKLPKKYFLRVHRSYIVAINKIEKYVLSSIEIGGKFTVPVGGNYREKVLEILNQKLL